MLLAFARLPLARAASSRRLGAVLCAWLALTVAAGGQQPETPKQPAPATAQPAPDAPETPAQPAAIQPAAAQDQVQDQVQDQAQAPARATSTDPQQAPAPAPHAEPAAPATAAQPIAAVRPAQPAPLSEEELKQMLVSKQFYLRGGYLADSISFDEHGRIIGHSPQGSYTLSVLEIDHVRLTKHKVELEGLRYGLHFNEQLSYEDSATPYDKVRITPKKKVVKITIDREMVVNAKKKRESSREKGQPAANPAPSAPAEGAEPSTCVSDATLTATFGEEYKQHEQATAVAPHYASGCISFKQIVPANEPATILWGASAHTALHHTFEP